MLPQTEYLPQTVSHPGTSLEEKLQEMGMSVKEFALRTCKPEKTIIAVLKGSSAITQEMAIKFENVTQIPAHFWIRRQSRYDEYKTREKLKISIEEASTWSKLFPYSEMANVGWVPKTRKTEEKTLNLFAFFGISSPIAWENLYMKSELKVAAYTSLKHTNDPHSISAWLRQGERQTEKIKTPQFNAQTFKANLLEIKNIMAMQPENYFSLLQDLCLQSGVKLIFTPQLPKAPINGSTRWINETPLIQLTARYKQNDRFWFTFFHEAGHILLHGKKYISLENIDFAAADPEKEQQAHQFAEEWIFPKKQEQELIATNNFTEENIYNFASKYGTHPAIIVGRLQHLKYIPFTSCRNFFVPIELKTMNNEQLSLNNEQ